ncbi:MAG: thioredoxin fold domain-containing protein [Gammaproteobacteria bacterium]|nr:thioredoxin fold domain-containing protein [Gammaproteobacteria bacterium]
MRFTFYSFLALIISVASPCYADKDTFSDKTLSQQIILPTWFKLSFLDLQDDLDEAIGGSKKGLIIYFGRKDCPYCKALLENNWNRDDIVYYTRKNFDVVAIDTKGTRNITDFDGFVYDEKSFSLKKKTNFTPSILFINKEGKVAFKLSGYQKPYRFMAALEYVADEHYKEQSFKHYLSQANDSFEVGGNDDLNFQSYFDSPPHNLNRKLFPAERPLAVFFEKTHCHACDILHSVPLENTNIRNKFEDLDVIQLDISSNQQIITPKGIKTNISEWTNKLNLHYSPTIVFFDESGAEIIRIDSVVWVHRLDRVLEYITTKAYKRFPSFQSWRLSLNLN